MLTFPPDISFVVQILSFLVLWFGLKRLLFDPTLQVLEARERRTLGERQAAEALQKAAQTAQAAYEQQMRAMRVTLAGESDTTFKATEAAEQKIIAEARAQANVELAQLRERLALEAGAARPALASEAQTLAGRMLERVIGRTVA